MIIAVHIEYLIIKCCVWNGHKTFSVTRLVQFETVRMSEDPEIRRPKSEVPGWLRKLNSQSIIEWFNKWPKTRENLDERRRPPTWLREERERNSEHKSESAASTDSRTQESFHFGQTRDSQKNTVGTSITQLQHSRQKRTILCIILGLVFIILFSVPVIVLIIVF